MIYYSTVKHSHEMQTPKRAWFIPGRRGSPEGPLTRYRPDQSVGAAKAYVQNFTASGDLVVDLFCQGPAIVRETVAADRRALGLSVNPLLILSARLGLGRRNRDAINAAFTSLADSLKRDTPLHRHLTSLYHSTCPACGASGVAEWFAWERDENRLFQKAVRCSECEQVQEGAPNDADAASAGRVSPRGLAYYYALDRVAPPGHPARKRAAKLIELYTPRNLSALMDLSRRMENSEANDETRIALTSVLLDCFDSGSSLDPYSEKRPRPRTLRVPARYIERNVWLCFQEGLTRLLAAPAPLPMQQAANVAALVQGETAGYALTNCAACDAQEIIPAKKAALIFVDPPRPDGVFWALSALWAGWLWKSPSVQAIRPFLRRRRFDWEWHRRVLQAALKAAGPLLAPHGYLVTLSSASQKERSQLLESVCLAASSAGYSLQGWGQASDLGHRIVWRWEPDRALQTTGDDVDKLRQSLTTAAEKIMVHTLQERGEPTTWPSLQASVYTELARQGKLAQDGSSTLALVADAVSQADETASIIPLPKPNADGKTVRWLTDTSRAAEPLTNRIGAATWEMLIQKSTWLPQELINALYARFHGPLTPDLKLVLVCVDSYSVQEEGDEGAHRLHLRPEDDPVQRAAEHKMLQDSLVALGQRLKFTVDQPGSWDVRWLEDGRDMYVFTISIRATLARRLLGKQSVDEGAQRCLVVPGGRAQLIDLKLQRDPRLSQAAEAGGWQFIKFRHLRRLLAEEKLDRHALKTVLGLDPIAEQEAAQIPLF